MIKFFLLNPLKLMLPDLGPKGLSIIEISSKKECLEQLSNWLESVYFLDLSDGLIPDIFYFIQNIKGPAVGGFYQKNNKQLLAWPDLKSYGVLNETYEDGYDIKKLCYLPAMVLKNLLQGSLDLNDSIEIIPMTIGLSKYSAWLEKKPYLFLDRDGILNEDRGYLGHFHEMTLYDEVIPIIKWANKKNIPVVVLTNQSGVARKNYLEADVQKTHDELKQYFLKKEADIESFFYCPFHFEKGLSPYNKKSLLRKPHPGMVLHFLGDRAIDFGRSVMIGDKVSDALPFKQLTNLHIRRQYDLVATKNKVFDSFLELQTFLEEHGLFKKT